MHPPGAFGARHAACKPVASSPLDAAAPLKIVILRGGPRPAAQQGPADRGITALSSGDGHWVLINVSAAVARQLAHDHTLADFAGLLDDDHRGDHRGPPEVRAVVLTDAQIEHVGGLIGLRGGAPIDLYATPAVFEDLSTHLPVLPVLRHYNALHWHVVPVAGDQAVATFRVAGLPSLEFTALANQAAPPPHSSHHDSPVTGDRIVLAVHDRQSGQRVFCAGGGARFGSIELEWMRQADCLLVDPLQGEAEHEWMRVLSSMPARHKVLMTEGAEGGGASHAALAAWAEQGIAVAFDRMAIEL